MTKMENFFGPTQVRRDERQILRANPDLERAKRKAAREKAARLEAEELLEKKSKELFELNADLKELNDSLEIIVRQRTEALRKSIARVEEQQRHAEFIARHDALTGLPNRRFVNEYLDADETNWKGAAILYIDLDRFKQINDTLGHAAGDTLLKIVAKRLRKSVPKGSIVARIGGDEFIVLLRTKDDPNHALKVADQIVKRLPEPIKYEGNLLRFGTSVGIALHHPNHSNHEEMMIEADLALYRAKEAGRGCAVLFSEEMREVSRSRKQLSDDLIEALEHGHIKPVYQPRICTTTGQIACVEALARWHHPERGVLDPGMFLSVAEDIGRLAEIDEAILTQALSDLETWDNAGIEVERVSVNVSGRRLLQTDLLTRLDGMNIPRDRISFELLESVFFDSADQDTIARLNEIRSRGINIEIDDFGSGHASINGLLAVHPDALKIDRFLVTAALDDERLIEILEAVVRIGKALGIKVVAEGVEQSSHAEMCKKIGCDQIQGYGISRPIPPDQIIEFARQNSSAHLLQAAS